MEGGGNRGQVGRGGKWYTGKGVRRGEEGSAGNRAGWGGGKMTWKH